MNLSPTRSNDPAVIVVGALHVDDIAIPLQNLHAGASNPVMWEQRVGGVACNVARVVSQQLPTQLIAAVGRDNLGELLPKLLAHEQLLVQTCIIDNERTGRYSVILDEHRDLFVGLSAVGIAEQLSFQQMHRHWPASPVSAVILDANLSQLCIQQTLAALPNLTPPTPSQAASSTALPEPLESPLQESSNTHSHTPSQCAPLQAPRQTPLIIALTVSPAKAIRWKGTATAVDLLICNRAEAAVLCDASAQTSMDELANQLAQQGFVRFIITDSHSPLLVHENGCCRYLPVPTLTPASAPSHEGTAQTAHKPVDELSEKSLPAILDKPTNNTQQPAIQNSVNGAGDALAGATVATWLQQPEHSRSLALAVETAGFAAAAAVLSGEWLAIEVL